MKKIRRIKISNSRIANQLLSSGGLANKYVQYTINDGPLSREIIINEFRENSNSTPPTFQNINRAIHRELQHVDQILLTKPFRLFHQEPEAGKPPILEMKRLARTFGDDTIQNMLNLRIGVVGAGRLGGPMIQELSAKGSSLIIVDKDNLEKENLPYLPPEANDFIGNPKVDFWASYCSGRYPHQEIIPIYGDVGEKETLNVLKGTDLLVVAIDEAFGRFFLNLLAVQYRIPILEMGTASEGSWAEDFSWYGRIRFLIPGEDGCLHCVEGLPIEEVSEEAKTPLEFEMLGGKHRGGANYRAVGHLSSQLCQAAMLRILGWLAGRNVRPVTELRLQDGQLEILESNGEAAQGCPVCGTDGLLGEGDNQPLPTSEMDLVNVGKRG